RRSISSWWVARPRASSTRAAAYRSTTRRSNVSERIGAAEAALVNVVVTGGAGFIGANFVRALLAEASTESVVVVDDLSTGDAANLDGLQEVELATCSILDRDELLRVMTAARPSAIVHLAAVPSVPRSIADPLRTHHANATGTLHVLE